jgi:hypothetical protein
MAAPGNRIPVRIARGTYANLNAELANIAEGEVCYAKDEDRLYVKEGGVLVSVQPDLSATVLNDITDVDTATTPPTTGQFLVYDGVVWEPGNALTSIQDDATPILGGDLEVGTRKITTTTLNADVTLLPNGTGRVVVEGTGTIPAGIVLKEEANGNQVTLTVPVAATLLTSYAITVPPTAGNVGEALTTDGTGICSWVEYIPLATLKTEVAASIDFADFKTRIAAL